MEISEILVSIFIARIHTKNDKSSYNQIPFQYCFRFSIYFTISKIIYGVNV